MCPKCAGMKRLGPYEAGAFSFICGCGAYIIHTPDPAQASVEYHYKTLRCSNCRQLVQVPRLGSDPAQAVVEAWEKYRKTRLDIQHLPFCDGSIGKKCDCGADDFTAALDALAKEEEG
jgi:hypothetical protein